MASTGPDGPSEEELKVQKFQEERAEKKAALEAKKKAEADEKEAKKAASRSKKRDEQKEVAKAQADKFAVERAEKQRLAEEKAARDRAELAKSGGGNDGISEMELMRRGGFAVTNEEELCDVLLLGGVYIAKGMFEGHICGILGKVRREATVREALSLSLNLIVGDG